MASGVLWFLACPSFDVWPLAWFAMVPAIVAIERAGTLKAAFFYSWLTGVVGNVGGFYWIALTLHRFIDAPWPLAVLALLLLCAYQALTFAGFGTITWLLRRRTALPVAAIAPLAMVSSELAVPMFFPFNVAITQAWQTHVIQIADITGPLGVTALLLLINGAIYDVLTTRRRRTVTALASVAIVAGVLVYGHVRIRQVDAIRAAAPPLEIGVVQPNVGFDTKGIDYPAAAAAQLRDLRAQSKALEAEGAELIIWPETAYPYRIGQDVVRDAPAGSGYAVRDGVSVPLVFGAISTNRVPRSTPGQRPSRYNSLFLIDRSGTFRSRYDKVFLVPFSEYTPAGDMVPVLARWMPHGAAGLTAGREVSVLSLQMTDGREYRVGPMICLEDTLPQFGRRLAEHRPHLLVNTTNDAWFGDTSEPWEHLALSVFRAVELRTDLIRAVQTGVSAHVDAAGRVRARSEVVDPATDDRGPERFRFRAALIEGGHTVYARISDTFGYVCAAITVALMVDVWRRSKSRPFRHHNRQRHVD